MCCAWQRSNWHRQKQQATSESSPTCLLQGLRTKTWHYTYSTGWVLYRKSGGEEFFKKIIICVTESPLQRSKTTENCFTADPRGLITSHLKSFVACHPWISLSVHISCHFCSGINTKLRIKSSKNTLIFSKNISSTAPLKKKRAIEMFL